MSGLVKCFAFTSNKVSWWHFVSVYNNITVFQSCFLAPFCQVSGKPLSSHVYDLGLNPVY